MDIQKIHDHFVIHHNLVLSEKQVIAICNLINEVEQEKVNCEHEWINTGLVADDEVTFLCKRCTAAKFIHKKKLCFIR